MMSEFQKHIDKALETVDEVRKGWELVDEGLDKINSELKKQGKKIELLGEIKIVDA